MTKADAKAEELVGMIERSDLRLPPVQRPYVWSSIRVCDSPSRLTGIKGTKHVEYLHTI